MTRNAFGCVALVVLVLFSGACPGPVAPTVTNFVINNGASSCATRSVTLDDTCTASPTHYMASESPSFTGASWLPYSTAAPFTLSAGNGTKTVHFKVKNAAGESTSVSDTITLSEPLVPDVVGMTEAAASTAITEADLTVGTVTEQHHATVSAGQVISQDPTAGASVALGSAVDLVISLGPVIVPNVVGMTEGAASTAITEAGLTVGTVTEQHHATVPAGQVISQNPASGASVAPGSAVNLVISLGPVIVPDVVGMTQAAAETAITGAGLTVGTVTLQHSATVPAGHVISETPTAGSSVAPGSAVDLVVSDGWTALPNMNYVRGGGSLTLLDDGRVLFIGGQTQWFMSDDRYTVAAAEIFDPNSQTFSLTGSLNTKRMTHGAVRLSDGRVLVAGGSGGGIFPELSTIEIFDPNSGSFTASGTMSTPRIYRPNCVEISDGTVLIGGGAYEGVNGTATANVDVFDPSNGQIQANIGSLVGARNYAFATLLSTGNVLFAGGMARFDTQTSPTTELYDGSSNTSRQPTHQLAYTLGIRTTGVSLDDGSVVLVGSGTVDPGYAVHYDPTTEVFTTLTSLGVVAPCEVLLLNSGKVLFGTDPIKICDISTGEVEQTVAWPEGWPGGDIDLHGVVLNDGRVLFVQLKTGQAYLLNVSDVTEQTIYLPGDVPLEMVWIPAETFMMGRYPGEQDSSAEEDPQHEVTLSQGFWMGKYELTKRQWTAVMGTTPWSGLLHVLNDLDSPAVSVSWNDAQAFITALNSDTGLTFRLPSEAEWEYTCRAGTTTRFHWGDDPSYTQIDDYAWWFGNAYNGGQLYAHVVGQKSPNAFGLYDMNGNVWEWCEDDYHSSYTGAPSDGGAWVDSPAGAYRIMRGGSWSCEDYNDRSASRGYYVPSDTHDSIGFRLCR